MSLKRLGVVLICVAAGLLSACSNSSKPMLAISPATADLLTGQSVQFTANNSSASNTLSWSVNGVAGGNMTVGTITSQGFYTAPTSQPAATLAVTVAPSSDPLDAATSIVTVVAPGQVTPTGNPQVAQYTISPPVAANVSVQFGTDTTYGLSTSLQQAAGGAAPLGIYVAGMRANTVYHMRGVLQMPDGSQLNDMDQTFTTGSLPATELPTTTVTTPNGLTPQPGIEMFDVLNAGSVFPAFATDLAGNVIWSYQPGGSSADLVQPIRPMTNGHFLVVDAPNSSDPIDNVTLPAGTLDVIREVDLAGNTIRELSVDTLNTRLAAAGFTYTADIIHHDAIVLPNGHWIIIVNSTQQFSNLPGITGTVTVLGDALVDLDTNLNPVWLWNSFDHLDVNRHPYQFPDWTHANAVLYSPTDGNLLLSMRHQNWIIKIDYANGKGAGDIIWHLGQGGDFTLEGGTNPTDWYYAQHGPSFTTQATTGSFGLAVFDNGDDREYPAGVTCASTGAPTCPYSTAQVYTIDETAMTATLTFNDTVPSYSLYGGNAEMLGNNNIEFDLCNIATSPPSTGVFEVTPDSPAETVWQLKMPASNAYRAFRIPSLYPGVQW